MIKIFADGADFTKICELNKIDYIKGFTTNPTLMRSEGVKDYSSFCKDLLSIVKEKPISFEVFADDFHEMKKQAHLISSWGGNVNVKIPITNTIGDSSIPLIKDLVESKIKCNVTAIFTIKQVQEILDNVDLNSELILSIFAGRIADTGVDPIPTISESVKLSEKFKNIQILWASTREVLNINQANEVGCHIITVTTDLIKKLNLKNKELNSYSLETVKMFFEDAQKSRYTI